ncbi:hypothetical protein ASC94_22850 [Massilia sp. Root418]|jgi:hypothetical protein|uniref:hypothetical protein n=1 Tax=Massilia sp. Root418 TaxID=1736532 RepID=UPI00070196DA|nr:hypothetical protein [Massilia sp. Root418]KQW89272.1 hypothetical protein ASC94_22850 [Massilia sp. Root418]
MKKTGMAKSDAKKLMGKMVAPGAAGFGNTGNTGNTGNAGEVVDKREQRRRDQALGLVPFAVKLNSELVAQLQALAKDSGKDLNEVVADVVTRGLAA